MGILISWILNAGALLITAYLVPGFNISDTISAFLAAIVLGFANTFIKPILLFLTAPFNLITLGLFTFVVNAVMLWIVGLVVPGFGIDNVYAAILAAVVLSFISTLLTHLLKDITKKK